MDRATIRRGDTGDDVEYCQQTLNRLGFDVGTADGIFGKNTETGVKNFQASVGLDDDGIVGPQTWAALDAAIEHPPTEPETPTEPVPPPCSDEKFTLSLYTHETGKHLIDGSCDDWLEAARDLGFSRIYIQTNSQGEGHVLSKMGSGSFPSRVARLEKACDYVRGYGLEACIMPWAPREEQIKETFEGYDDMPSLPAIMDRCGIKRCDWDEEGKPEPGVNILSADDAVEMRAYLAQYPQYEWSWDTHAAKFTPSRHMLVSEEILIGVVQAYHMYSTEKPERYWGERHGPGNRQVYALDKMDDVDAKRTTPLKRAVILALWWQYKSDAVPESGYADHPGEESILEGVQVCWDAGIRDLRFWRGPHVAFRWTRKAIEEMRRRGWV
jgi:hypothetical protein